MATIPAAEVRSVIVGGQQLRVAIRRGRAASAGRPALLLINGIGVSLEMLEPLVRELDPDVDVIRFDPPGIGGSAQPPVPYRFTGLCELISRMLTELGYDRVDILGISWGGGVAQHFALFRGSRCRRLVLAATATGALMVPAKPPVLAQLMVMPPQRQMDREYLNRVVGEVFGGSARRRPERVATAMSEGNWLASPLGYLYQLTATAAWSSLPFLPVIRQPVLILAGDDDPIIPLVNARLMNLLIPKSRLHVYHGGHLDLATEASGLAPAVDAFLAAPLYDGQLAGSRLGPVEIDEGKPDVGPHYLLQPRRGLGHDDLQGREHPSFDEMTAGLGRVSHKPHMTAPGAGPAAAGHIANLAPASRPRAEPAGRLGIQPRPLNPPESHIHWSETASPAKS